LQLERALLLFCQTNIGTSLDFHRISLYFLYGITAATVCLLLANGWDYYRLPLNERPHSELHKDWKPSGTISHGIGIVGSAMILLLLLYIARKRMRFMQRWGNIRYWLNYHIWLGITGPILILFHTTFKFGGIVAVSFWSMVAVVLSGVLGRYIYVQIPRSKTGQELSAVELEAMHLDLRNQLIAEAKGDESVLTEVQALLKSGDTSQNEFSSLMSWLLYDLFEPFKLRRIRSGLRKSGKLSEANIRLIVSLAKREFRLDRRIAFLDTARKLLHHWHVFHKPFAIIMILIMFVHIAVAIAFGYTWVF
jgi:hypothetical protein